jgi:undecaprenyl-diphosphatase
MDQLHAIYLAMLQGFTEFLPISSSGHLILLPNLFGWQDQGLAFDVAVHIGSLIAVASYFRHELKLMSVDWISSVKTRQLTGESRLAWAVLFGTIPAGLAGLFMKDFVELYLRSPLVIAITTVLFGALLWWADVTGKRRRNEHSLGWFDVLFIGVAQAIALIPGTSRSGITMTAGLMLGLSREAAARFSFLLSIPIIMLAGGYLSLQLLQSDVAIDWGQLALGIVVSAITAYLCIHYFLKLLNRMGMLPFVIYRFVLGGLLFYLVFMQPGFFSHVQ